jgi:hypothetical protein
MEFRNVPPSDGFDTDLLQRVTRFLNQKGHVLLQSLEITVDQGVVLVRGRVPTFYLRQVAIACIKHVAGVTKVVDLIEVVSGPSKRALSVDCEEQKESEESRFDVAGITRTAREAHQGHARNRQPHSTAMESSGWS